jgi:hypothetical protein
MIQSWLVVTKQTPLAARRLVVAAERRGRGRGDRVRAQGLEAGLDHPRPAAAAVH